MAQAAILGKFVRVYNQFFSFPAGMSKEATSKMQLRTEMRGLLRGLRQEHIDAASSIICKHISEAEGLVGKAENVAIYATHGPEVDLSALHELLPGVRLLYPLCLPARRLSFHHVANPAQLVPGMLNIPEPDPEQHEQVPDTEIDVILCPGLVFGEDGARLGHGGGYYDRILERFNGVICGVGMDLQMRRLVPHDAHDILMQHLASESGVMPARHP